MGDTIIGFLIAIVSVSLVIERDVIKNIEVEVTKKRKLIFEWNSKYYKNKKIWIYNMGEVNILYSTIIKELDLDQIEQSISSKNMRSVKFKEIFDEYEPVGKIEIYGYTIIEKSKAKFFYTGKISLLGQILNWFDGGIH